MTVRADRCRPPLHARRRYGWRDVAAVLGMYAILLQLGLGVVAGLAGEAIAKERAGSGTAISALALEICSPAGLIRLADDSDEAPSRGAPVCPGCLVAHAGPLPPSVTVAPRVSPDVRSPFRIARVCDGVAAIERITALNPRAPPVPHG